MNDNGSNVVEHPCAGVAGAASYPHAFISPESHGFVDLLLDILLVVYYPPKSEGRRSRWAVAGKKDGTAGRR